MCVLQVKIVVTMKHILIRMPFNAFHERHLAHERSYPRSCTHIGDDGSDSIVFMEMDTLSLEPTRRLKWGLDPDAPVPVSSSFFFVDRSLSRSLSLHHSG